MKQEWIDGDRKFTRDYSKATSYSFYLEEQLLKSYEDRTGSYKEYEKWIKIRFNADDAIVFDPCSIPLIKIFQRYSQGYPYCSKGPEDRSPSLDEFLDYYKGKINDDLLKKLEVEVKSFREKEIEHLMS